VASEAPAERRRVGRPRAVPREGSDDPAEEILFVAAGLFSTLGYAKTTTRQIADGVGLRQGSLAHYFPRKDDMLAELLDRTVAEPLRYLDQIGELDEPVDQKLFTLVQRDTLNLCSGPHNLGALLLLPEARAERFDSYWARRATLLDGYRSLIRDGVDTGLMDAPDVDLAADILFGLVESVITWFVRGGPHQPTAVARSVTHSAMRGLLIPETRIAEMQVTFDDQHAAT
jgi:AcrR family transcriptional regulator